MTDLTPLSPAARAVVAAIKPTCDEDEMIRLSDVQIAVAALRAASWQITSAKAIDTLRAIAAELEAYAND